MVPCRADRQKHQSPFRFGSRGETSSDSTDDSSSTSRFSFYYSFVQKQKFINIDADTFLGIGVREDVEARSALDA